MRDPNLILLLSGTLFVFSAIALYGHRGVHVFSRRARIRPPHRALLGVLRVWFGLLAAGCAVLLTMPLWRR